MNSQYKIYATHKKYSVKQRGVVLFIALIALVVMSLAAVALIRSVDTSTIIAGNLAFKQSATLSADSGLESAASWLASNPAGLTANLPAAGYFATSAVDAKTLVDVDANTAVASGNGIAAGTDSSGNTIRYVIQRMCSATGAPTINTCLFGSPIDDNNSQGVKDATQAGGAPAPQQSLVYRVTARVSGPQYTVSYIQAFIY